MRFFLGTPEQFDAMRNAVMDAMGMPNQFADAPWPQGISSLALGAHHYEPEQYAAMVASALELGIVEVSEAEYQAAQPNLQISP